MFMKLVGKYIFINGLQILDNYKITLMSLKWIGDKLMWMMNKHSNLLVIFMLTNCTSFCNQLTWLYNAQTHIQDGIQLLNHKHHQFANWHGWESYCGFQNEQFETHNMWAKTWTKVKVMKITIIKRWEKTRFIRVWDNN